MMTVLEEQIKEKIAYHEELRLKFEIDEEYEQCAKQRDEIARLNRMLEKPVLPSQAYAAKE